MNEDIKEQLKNNSIKLEYNKLSDSEKTFIKSIERCENVSSIDKELLNQLIDNKWIEIKNESFFVGKKYIELRKAYLPRILNIGNLRAKVRNGMSKKEALFILETFEERILELKNDIEVISRQVSNCEHDFKPSNASWRMDLFASGCIYDWVSTCQHCGKQITEKTTSDERPIGFEKINIRDSNI